MTTPPRHRFGAIVFALAWLAYGAALAGDLVFDDVHSVAANTALHDLGNLGRLLVDPSAFSASGQHMYRPVLLVSIALNYALAAAPWMLKAGNVLLHAGVAWLLWHWLRGLRLPARASFAAAAVFAVHPLASEAVNLVSARSELLLALGFLLALRGHQLWLARRWPALACAGIVAGLLIACGSKETGVVLPALLVVQELWWRHRGGDGWSLRRAVAVLVPVVALVLGYLVLRKLLLGQATVDLMGRGGGADPTMGHGRSLAVQLATMGTLLPQALLQVVAPLHLTLDPPVTYRSSFADPCVLVGWASLLGLGVAALAGGPRAWVRRVGLAVAILVALPWIVVPLNAPLAEHRLYGPMLGLAALGAAVLPRLHGRRWQVVLSAVLLLGVVGATRRSLDYRDEVALWQAELAAQPASFAGWWGLGAALLQRGDAVAAIEPLARAHALRPQHLAALQHYAEALVSLPDDVAQPSRSLVVTELLLMRQPDDAWTRTLVAQAHLQAGAATGEREHWQEAEAVALSCLSIAPPKGYVFQLAAAARRGLGDLDGALAHLDESVRRGLAHTAVRLDRARLLRDLGRPADARRELLRAQAQAPMDPAVQQALFELAQPPR